MAENHLCDTLSFYFVLYFLGSNYCGCNLSLHPLVKVGLSARPTCLLGYVFIIDLNLMGLTVQSQSKIDQDICHSGGILNLAFFGD